MAPSVKSVWRRGADHTRKRGRGARGAGFVFSEFMLLDGYQAAGAIRGSFRLQWFGLAANESTPMSVGTPCQPRCWVYGGERHSIRKKLDFWYSICDYIKAKSTEGALRCNFDSTY